MAIYEKSEYPVSSTIEALHEDELASFTQCGTWGTGAQRAVVAATARTARYEAGLQEKSDDPPITTNAGLPDVALQLASEVALGATNIDRDYFNNVTSQGVTPGAYIEIVGVVSRLVNLDIFSRGIGLSPRPLDPVEDEGTPDFALPDEAVDEGFFVNSVPSPPAGGSLGESLYGKNPAGNILRSLSLVPAEARRVINLIGNQYYSSEQLMDFSASSSHALSRAQVEVVASKVSEHNRCFY